MTAQSHAIDTRPAVEVAVGVVIRDDGRVLLGQRVPGKPYAGWWEFPGGKLERGETVAQALARELHEELGLDVVESVPWVVREFSYPHARVRLHFRRVLRFSGEPRSREGQAYTWCAPDAIDVAPLLPATVPVLAWLRLPPVLAISHAESLGADAYVAALERALARGLRLVQLREKTMGEGEFASLFRRVLAACRAAGARLVVNSAHPESFWHAADGVHLESARLLACAARPRVRLVGASVHDAAQLAAAARLGADYAVLGPVRPTDSHPGAPALGWAGFEAIARDAAMPVYALGGLAWRDAPRARAAGAHGVAMLRAAWRDDAAYA